jgi:hypothetical protein
LIYIREIRAAGDGATDEQRKRKFQVWKKKREMKFGNSRARELYSGLSEIESERTQQ